jgi:hypothetical protein
MLRGVEASAVVSGREFSDELIERLNAAVRAHPDMSRSELSQRVCNWLGWKGPDGDPKQVSCRVALLKLHRRGLIVSDHFKTSLLNPMDHRASFFAASSRAL